MNPVVVIQHQTDGHGNYIKCKSVTRKVDVVMLNGRVRDSHGEVWRVRKGGDNRYYTEG
jgi:hypothetical protein